MIMLICFVVIGQHIKWYINRNWGKFKNIINTVSSWNIWKIIIQKDECSFHYQIFISPSHADKGKWVNNVGLSGRPSVRPWTRFLELTHEVLAQLFCHLVSAFKPWFSWPYWCLSWLRNSVPLVAKLVSSDRASTLGAHMHQIAGSD